MRCAEARRRLNRPNRSTSDLSTDNELQSHIEECRECALHYKTAQDLQTAFRDAKLSDDDGITFEHLKTRVNARARQVQQPGWRLIKVMSKLRKQLEKSPRLSVSIALIVIAVGISTLVPFKYDRTIGYEVAVAGVDKELALDEQKMNAFLMKLGVEDAIVDVTGCEKTCEIIIRELKNPNDAELITIALQEIDGNKLIEIKAVPVIELGAGTLIDRAHNTFIVKLNEVLEGSAREHIVEKFGEDYHTYINLYFTEEDSCSGPIQFNVQTKMGECVTLDKIGPGTDNDFVFVSESCQGDTINICELINLNEGDFDPTDLKRLEALGFKVQTSTNENGDVAIKLVRIGENTDDPADTAAKQVDGSDLPEGFELSQNYPNPFNPTTTISYSIAEPSQVTIELFNINGQKVRSLVDCFESSGTHSVVWDSRNNEGEQVSSGIYFYRLTAGDVTVSKKMNFLK